MLRDPMNYLAVIVVVAIFHAYSREPAPTHHAQCVVVDDGTIDDSVPDV